MASAADVQEVQDNLPPEATTLGWTDSKIAEVLDAGNTVTKTVRAFWQYRVAQTHELVSISESGSSRDLEAIWKHALAMLEYWDGRVKADDAEQGNFNPKQGIAFHTATRV